MYTIQLNTWGNSIGIRLPKSVIEALDLKVGSKITMSVNQNQIVLIPKYPTRAFPELLDVKTMAEQITRQNKPDADEFDNQPIGKELW